MPRPIKASLHKFFFGIVDEVGYRLTNEFCTGSSGRVYLRCTCSSTQVGKRSGR